MLYLTQPKTERQMQAKDTKTRVYIERGRKTVLAGAVDWPGWMGAGETDVEALLSLFDEAPKYAAVLHAAQQDFTPPVSRHDFDLIETLAGGWATDLGGPHLAPHADAAAISEADYMRLQAILLACWQAFDAAIAGAEGHNLATPQSGPNLSLEEIIIHVIQNDQSDLERLAWSHRFRNLPNPLDELREIREGTLRALTRAAFGEIPAVATTGELWNARFFVRKIAWHTLTHTWEIEQRLR